MSIDTITLGGGCFWCLEAVFERVEGVTGVESGYSNGEVHHPSYEQVCAGHTGHAEVVQVTYDPAKVSFDELLRVFWENHDPTQGDRQGNDVGTQYRSAIFTTAPEQRRAAEASRDAYQRRLSAEGHGRITTEIADAPEFWPAEEYHQRYLEKNPGGYCGLGGTGVACPAPQRR